MLIIYHPLLVIFNSDEVTFTIFNGFHLFYFFKNVGYDRIYELSLTFSLLDVNTTANVFFNAFYYVILFFVLETYFYRFFLPK